MKIQNYVQDNTLSIYDKLVGTDAQDSSKTKNFEIGSVLGLLGNITQGPAGPQGNPGVQGIPGTPGAVGPAGLEWKGAWTSGTSYVADDAVGYGGSSWFCILATSGTTTPNLDTTHWALLASQGAQGPQGIAGPTGATGAQGPAGSSTVPNGTNGGVAASVAPYPILQYDINTVYTDNGIYRLPLLDNTYVGKQVIVQVQGFISSNVTIKAYNEASTISTNQTNGSVASVYLPPNTRCRFTYLGGDYWFSEYLWANKLRINGQTLKYDNNLRLLEINGTTSPLSLSELNLGWSYGSQFEIDYHIGFQLVCPNISTGGLIYTKTSGSSWVSSPIETVV